MSVDERVESCLVVKSPLPKRRMWFFPCCTPDSMYDLLMWNLFEEIQEPFSSHAVSFEAQPVVNTLSELWRPLISKGALRKQDFVDATLLKESNFEKVDVEGLISTIQKIRSPTSPEHVGTFSVSSNQRVIGPCGKQY